MTVLNYYARRCQRIMPEHYITLALVILFVAPLGHAAWLAPGAWNAFYADFPMPFFASTACSQFAWKSAVFVQNWFDLDTTCCSWLWSNAVQVRLIDSSSVLSVVGHLIIFHHTYYISLKPTNRYFHASQYAIRSGSNHKFFYCCQAIIA